MIMSRSALRIGVAAFALALGNVAAAAQAQAQPALSLTAGPLADSLNALSRSASVEILADPALLRGKKAQPVRAASSPAAALGQLLRGSGLGFEKRGGTFLIVQKDTAARPTASRATDGRPRSPRESADPVAEAHPAPEPEDIIMVTGSRIARPELESAMPVSIVNMAQAELFGRTTAYDALMREPGVGVGIGPASSFGQSWDSGMSTVSLRNLGTNRSLTLIDGMRRVSGSAQSSAVDLAMIPSAMIERIEIVTGGAAAIYGADAVSGAVNVITKRNFQGMELSAQNGVSHYGDMSRLTISGIVGGTISDDRGSFVVGGTYTQNPELAIADRDFARGASTYLANAKNTGPNDGIPDQILIRDFRGLYISPVPTFFHNGSSYLLENGALMKGQYDTQYLGGQYSVGTGGNSYPASYRGYMLSQELKSFAVVSRVDYKITEGITFNARVDYGHTTSVNRAENYRDDSRAVFMGGAGGAVAYLDNPYMPASVRQYMQANGLGRLNIDRVYSNFPKKEELHDRQTVNLFAGLEGRLVDRFNWEVFYQYGRSQDDVDTKNGPFRSHWIAARDAIADPVTGRPICRDAAARAAGCVPFNIFGTDPVTAAQLAYATGTRMERRLNTQSIVGANITGKLLPLPYGDLSFSLGVEHRRDALKTTDSADELGNELTAPGLMAIHPELDEAFTVSEVFGELVAPVLRDLPFAHRLEVEGAYRYSRYNTFGATNTWKAGATWSPIEGLTLRGVRSRSVRAPNFGELYAPATESITGSINDPCKVGLYNNSPARASNCAALGITTPLPHYSDAVVITAGGNRNLQPETSNSLTFGAVLQPKLLPGLSLVADYWDIDITNVIAQFGYIDILNLCVDLSNTNNVFCRQAVRGSNGKVQRVYSNQINASRMRARGIDFGLDYRHRVGPGKLGLSFKGTYLIERQVQTTPGIATGNINYDGGINDPRFRGDLTISYDVGQVSAAVDTRFISAGLVYPNRVSAEYVDVNQIPAVVYNDISVRFAPKDNVTIGFGINNVLNVTPPKFPTVEWGAGGLYDTIGRYFFATAKIKL